ncbi:MAG: hypothetical protein IKG57_11315, partial [Enterococcus sp.]|uniref:hypothetical protein n=1 Tax=Enterococcus sp. TaxID=35783 RepID=UPI00257FF737
LSASGNWVSNKVMVGIFKKWLKIKVFRGSSLNRLCQDAALTSNFYKKHGQKRKNWAIFRLTTAES